MNIYVHTLLNTDLSGKIKAVFEDNHQIHFRTETVLPDQAPAGFVNANAILGNPPIKWFADRTPPDLKFWQLDSAGFDQYKAIPTSARVANMGDWFAWPCAETIIGGVLALYRGLNKLSVLQKDKKWIGTPLREELTLLHKKNVVVLGAGTIGLAVKSILKGFNATCHVVARSSPEAEIHSKDELLQLLPRIDLVINTLPGAAGRYVDQEFLQAMKKNSVYANVGRGTTTDESALIQLLKEGHLAGAVLDVTEIEPLPASSPLWELENVILTQHTGGGQANEDDGKADNFIENFSRYLREEPLLHEVELGRGY